MSLLQARPWGSVQLTKPIDFKETSVSSGDGARIKRQTYFFLVPKTTPQAAATAITAQAIKATSNRNQRMLMPHILFLRLSSGG
jgi:hypothetical protein